MGFVGAETSYLPSGIKQFLVACDGRGGGASPRLCKGTKKKTLTIAKSPRRHLVERQQGKEVWWFHVRGPMSKMLGQASLKLEVKRERSAGSSRKGNWGEEGKVRGNGDGIANGNGDRGKKQGVPKAREKEHYPTDMRARGT